MDPGIYIVDEAGALYQVPDYLPAAGLPDPRAGVGDPMPLAQRMRRFFPGAPTGSNAFLTVPGGGTRLVIPDDALSVILQVQVAPLRYTFDGSVPSNVNVLRADVGTLLALTGRDWMHALLM